MFGRFSKPKESKSDFVIEQDEEDGIIAISTCGFFLEAVLYYKILISFGVVFLSWIWIENLTSNMLFFIIHRLQRASL